MPLIARVLTPELMDDPALDPGEHALALRGLARINRWSRSAAIVARVIREISAAGPGPLRVLDVATGSGDVPVSLCRWAARTGVDLRIEACDINPVALGAARARAEAAGACLGTHRLDATSEALPGGFDLAVCSLFLHHLTADQAVRVLGAMGSAARLVAVNDLRRCRRGLALAWTGSRALCRSRVVRTDAVRSVRAAWTEREAVGLAVRAGLEEIRIRRAWPFRMLMTCRKARDPMASSNLWHAARGT